MTCREWVSAANIKAMIHLVGIGDTFTDCAIVDRARA
jgi:hypothetical protein